MLEETPNWKAMFVKKMLDRKPRDKWVLSLTERLSHRQLIIGRHVDFQQHLFASFRCSSCSHSWKSSQVVIGFAMQLFETTISNEKHGCVEMKIFGQKCNRCKNSKYEEPLFFSDAVQYIINDLAQKVLKKCYGEFDHNTPIRKPVDEFLQGPHESKNCEACEHGLCSEGRRPTFTAQSWRNESSPVDPSFLGWSEEEMTCFVLVVLVVVIALLFGGRATWAP